MLLIARFPRTMEDKSTRRCTSKITRTHFVITFIVLTMLVFLLEENYFDATMYMQQNKVNATVGNCVKHHFLDGFTLIIQTYRRTDLLMKQLEHYSTFPRLHKIIVVWNNIGVKPPVEDWKKLVPHSVPVVFLPQDNNTIRNRFKPFKEIETEGPLARYDSNENRNFSLAWP